MSRVSADVMISLDGFIAGPNIRVDNPGGDGAQQLHEWIASLASWRERQGMSGGEENLDSEIIREWFDSYGAVIMGRTMFETGSEFWGETPPFRVPVFVLTHRPRPAIVKQGGTTFTFVTDGIESALARARAVCGTRDVDIAGGGSTLQQYLRAGLIDELQLHMVPVLFGQGLRLFDQIGAGPRQLEPIRIVQGSAVTHLKYRILR